MYNVETLLENLRKAKEIDNKEAVLNSSDFRSAAIIAKSFLTAQSYGALLERWIKNYFNFSNKKNNLSGDASSSSYKIEIKTSIEDAKGGFNFVQIRPSHDIDFYLCACYNITKDIVTWFLIPSKDMYRLVEESGGYAHGTIQAQGEITNIEGSTKEYSYRPSENARENTKPNKRWKSLLTFQKTEDELRSILH